MRPRVPSQRDGRAHLLCLVAALAAGCVETPAGDAGDGGVGADAARRLDAPMPEDAPGPDAPLGDLDRGCIDDSDCGGRSCVPEQPCSEEVAARFECVLDPTFGERLDVPGGLCTNACADDSECAPTERCVVLNASFEGACVPRCDPTVLPRGGCRPGWACDPTRRACVEGCTTDANCEPGCIETRSCSTRDVAFVGISFVGPAGGRCNVETGRCEAEPIDDRQGGACRLDVECGENGVCAHLTPWPPPLEGPEPSGTCTIRGCDVPGRECRAPASVCVAEPGADSPADTHCVARCVVGAGEGRQTLDGAPGCPPSYVCDAPSGASRPEDGLCQPLISDGGDIPYRFGGFTGELRRNLDAVCFDSHRCWSPFGRGACVARDGLVRPRAPSPYSGQAVCTVLDCDDPGLPADLCGPSHRCVALPTTELTFCARRCSVASDCLEAEACVDDDRDASTERACLPVCLSDADCRAGSQCVLDERLRVGRCELRSPCEGAVRLDGLHPTEPDGTWVVDLDFGDLPMVPVTEASGTCGGEASDVAMRQRAIEFLPLADGVLRAWVDETRSFYDAAYLSIRTDCEVPWSELPALARPGIYQRCFQQRFDAVVRAGEPVTVMITDFDDVDDHRVRLLFAPSREEGERCDDRGVRPVSADVSTVDWVPFGLRDECGGLACLDRGPEGPTCGPLPTCAAPIDLSDGAYLGPDGAVCWAGDLPLGFAVSPLVYVAPRDAAFEPPLRVYPDCEGSGPSTRVEYAREGERLYPVWTTVSSNALLRPGEVCDGYQIGVRVLPVRAPGEACDPSARRDRCEEGLVCTREGAPAPRCIERPTSCAEPIALDDIATREGEDRVFAVAPGLTAASCGDPGSEPTAFIEVVAWADGTLEIEGVDAQPVEGSLSSRCEGCVTFLLTSRPRLDVVAGDRVSLALVPRRDVIPGPIWTLAGVRARIVPRPGPGEPCLGEECSAGHHCVALGTDSRCEVSPPDYASGTLGCVVPSELLEGWDGTFREDVLRWEVAGGITTRCSLDPRGDLYEGAWLRVAAPRDGVFVAEAPAGFPLVLRQECSDDVRDCDLASSGRAVRMTEAVRTGETLLLGVAAGAGERTLRISLAAPLAEGSECSHDSFTEACGEGLACADLGTAPPRCVPREAP